MTGTSERPSGAGEPEGGYEACIDAMAEAAQIWFRQHPFAELHFSDFAGEVAREHGKERDEVAIISPLSPVIDRWAANEDARLFLRALDDASQGEATFMMAKVIIDQAREQMLEQASGKLSDDGEWVCPGCGERASGFTRPDGEAQPPGPGDLSVCFSCGALSQVNAQGSGYERLSTRAFNALPKSARMQLRSMQNGVRRRIERQRARS